LFYITTFTIFLGTIIIFLAGLIFFALFIIYPVFILNSNILIITDERILKVKRKNIFEKLETETELGQITQVLYRIKGFWHTIFRYGAVLIKISGDHQSILFKNAKKPQKVQQLILGLKKQFS